MTDDRLPLGEERDPLRDAADRILRASAPAARPPAGRAAAAPRRADLPLDAPRHRGASVPLYKGDSRGRTDDDRVMGERASYQPRNPFRADSNSDVAPNGGGGFNDPFVKLAGITFTKKQFVELVNVDLPRLLREAKAEETQRGKLLRGILVPALQAAMQDNGFSLPTTAKDTP